MMRELETLVTIETAMICTPVGALTVALRDGAACAIGFDEQWPALLAVIERRFARVARLRWCEAPHRDACSRIVRYFDGDLAALDGVRVDADGTPFQRAVWSELRAIAPGATLSYAALARAVGAPRAIRAIGRANAQNPVSLVVPCHRVIASDGTLRGYAGGLARKAWLLDHERAHERDAHAPISSFASTSPTALPSQTIACSASSSGRRATPRSRAKRHAVAIAG